MCSGYKPGDLLFIRPSGRNSFSGKEGVFAIYQRSYQGDDDISYHGSPCYEEYIVCRELPNMVEKSYGELDYEWCSAAGRIKYLEDTLCSIRTIANV